MQLDDLSNEVLVHICNALDRNSLCKLRLVNKRLSLFATPTLARNHMSQLAVLMTPQSLGLLGDVCSHPVFGSHVRGIHLTSGRICSWFVEEVARWVRGAEDVGGQKLQDNKASLQKMEKRLSGEMKLIAEPYMAIALLIRVFEALKRFGHPIAVSMTDNDRGGILSRHQDKLLLGPDGFDAVTENYFNDPGVDIGSTVNPCFKAIAIAHFALDAIDLDLNPMNENPGHFVAESEAATCSRLRSIRLHIPDFFHPKGLESIKQILSHTHNLEEFDLASDEWEERLPPSKIVFCEDLLDSVTSRRLKSLAVNVCAFSYKSLIKLLARQHYTLCELTLVEVALRGATWRQFFEWARNNLPCLASVHMTLLMKVEEPRRPGGSYRTKIVTHGTQGKIKGVKRVRAELDGLVNIQAAKRPSKHHAIPQGHEGVGPPAIE